MSGRAAKFVGGRVGRSPPSDFQRWRKPVGAAGIQNLSMSLNVEIGPQLPTQVTGIWRGHISPMRCPGRHVAVPTVGSAVTVLEAEVIGQYLRQFLTVLSVLVGSWLRPLLLVQHALGLKNLACFPRTRSRVAIVVTLCMMWAAPPTVAQQLPPQGPRHGLSAFGDFKYAPDFKHFDYVNPSAPKGGRLAFIGPLGRITFDSFNGHILRGTAAQGLSGLFEDFNLIYDTLMTRAYDEPDAVYGLVASSAEIAADTMSVTFQMRPEARFADGSALTADDVVFTFNTLKADGHPTYRFSQLRDVVSAEALSSTSVRYTFQGDRTRALPRIVALLPILSKAFYTRVPFTETSLEPPLGSGPYRIAKFEQGQNVIYQRREDYWARDLPVRRGKFNFDEVRYEYFRDRSIALEAIKAGVLDLREEFTARDWVTAYDIPAVQQGKLKRLELPDGRPAGAQGFMLNSRLTKFKDPRVREALGLIFDFEWTNKNLFYDLYARTESFFENSPLKATGTPGADELALLEPFRQALPPSVFAAALTPPKSDGSGQDRRLLAEAVRKLDLAGWPVKNGKRTGPDGTVLEIEFLIVDASSERILGPFTKTLNALGIPAIARRVDPAQYEERTKAFNFDIVTTRYAMDPTPGPGLSAIFGSDAAKTVGSLNLTGMSNPAIDALIVKAEAARTRAELTTVIRALDRVIRSGHYWIPQWHKKTYSVAHWDKYGRPATTPTYQSGIAMTWWYDAQKAAILTGK